MNLDPTTPRPPGRFNYATLGGNARGIAEAAADQLWKLDRDSVFERGRHLVDVSEALDPGDFRLWLTRCT